jgi:hypothetical protein
VNEQNEQLGLYANCVSSYNHDKWINGLAVGASVKKESPAPSACCSVSHCDILAQSIAHNIDKEVMNIYNQMESKPEDPRELIWTVKDIKTDTIVNIHLPQSMIAKLTSDINTTYMGS